jgi:hypothetical protein
MGGMVFGDCDRTSFASSESRDLYVCRYMAVWWKPNRGSCTNGSMLSGDEETLNSSEVKLTNRGESIF